MHLYFLLQFAELSELVSRVCGLHIVGIGNQSEEASQFVLQFVTRKYVYKATVIKRTL